MKNLHDSSLFAEREWRRIAESLCVSPRELQIIQGVFNDMKESAIAGRLGISPHTVHTYLERIYRKLVVNSRVQMVVRVVTEHFRLTEREQDAVTLSDSPASRSRSAEMDSRPRLQEVSWSPSASSFFTGTGS